MNNMNDNEIYDINKLTLAIEKWQSLQNSNIDQQQSIFGSCCIALEKPQKAVNVGSVMRAVGCFKANMVAISGKKFKVVSSDVHHQSRFTPVLNVDNLKEVIPFGHVPVAVELIDGAIPLQDYEHPPQAFYVFGAENMTLGKRTLSWCRDIVYIPTKGSLNLAMCVNIVMYDRMAKRLRKLDKLKEI